MDSTRQIFVELSADFVLSRCTPTVEEARFGASHRLLSEKEAKTVLAGIQYRTEEQRDLIDEFVVPLTDGELERYQKEIHRRVPELEKNGKWQPAPERLWVFLLLDWLYTNRHDSALELAPGKMAKDFGLDEHSPVQVISLIHCDFGHPDEISGLVYYLPPKPSEPVGYPALFAKFENYVMRMRKFYAARRGF